MIIYVKRFVKTGKVLCPVIGANKLCLLYASHTHKIFPDQD